MDQVFSSTDLRCFYIAYLETDLICIKIIVKEVDIRVAIKVVAIKVNDINIRIAVIE